jgi:galactokinase
MMQEHQSEFSENVYKRCTYIIEENQRVENACKALLDNDFNTFGQLMFASHKGLQEKFEVSCVELDQLVSLAATIDGVIGSRMMGGGFGGCTINLVKRKSAGHFTETIKKRYKTPEQSEPEIIEVVIDQGTHIIDEH